MNNLVQWFNEYFLLFFFAGSNKFKAVQRHCHSFEQNANVSVKWATPTQHIVFQHIYMYIYMAMIISKCISRIKYCKGDLTFQRNIAI